MVKVIVIIKSFRTGQPMLKQDGLLEKLDTKICIGQGYRGKTGTLGIGSCTRGFATYLKGCPPTDEEIYHILKKCIQKKEERI